MIAFIPSTASHDYIVNKVNEIVRRLNEITKEEDNGQRLILDVTDLTENQQNELEKLHNIFTNLNKRAQK